MKTNKMLTISIFCKNVVKQYVVVALLIILYLILNFQNGNCTWFADFFLMHLWHVTFISLSHQRVILRYFHSTKNDISSFYIHKKEALFIHVQRVLRIFLYELSPFLYFQCPLMHFQQKKRRLVLMFQSSSSTRAKSFTNT